ncbi:hypothetical protein JTB14_002544 [Gonioctena quinquepunctata]|nr:hypothetical protein JTB14_002544 [Gonioctena quinquepunctata]
MMKSTPNPGQSKKLQQKYHGPYQISEVLDRDWYIIEDIPGAQHTQMFYQGTLPSDRLRLYLPDEDDDLSPSSDEDNVDADPLDGQDARHVSLVDCSGPTPSLTTT